MAGRHQGDTKEFRDLTFAEQAKSITATINNLQAAITHHIEHSPHAAETIEKCLAQVDRLRQRLRKAYEPGSGAGATAIDERPPIHLRSPRLAEPERAADFTMEVAEVAPDARLR